MKLFSLAVAAIAALSGFAQAKEQFNREEFKREMTHRMNNNLYNKDVLMKGAKPHSEAARKLGNNNNNNNFITGDYSIQFIQCFSLSTSYEEMFGEGGNNNNNNGGGMALNLFANGKLLAERSYAIFKVVYTKSRNNNYYNSNNALEYVIDLQTYIQALVMYLPEQLESFCEGCKENEESCASEMYAYTSGYGYGYNNGYGNGYGNNYGGGYYGNYNRNGGRKLSEVENIERKLKGGENTVYRQLNCELCYQYDCINVNGNNDNNKDKDNQFGFEAASEWLANIASCYQTGAYYGGYYGNNQNGGGKDNDGSLYAGFICNADGTGVEIGMFLDEECLLYLPNEPFSNYMSYFDASYQDMTKDIIEFTFDRATKISCKAEEITWTTQDLSMYGGYYQNQNWDGNNNNNREEELADWCQALIENEQDTYPIDMYTCGGKYSGNYRYNNNNNNDAYQYLYSWYTYEITEEDSLDMYAVCNAAKNSKGNLHTFYNTNNGNMYSYKKGSSNNATEFLEETGTVTRESSSSNHLAFDLDLSEYDLSGAAKLGIVALVGGILGCCIMLISHCCRSGSSERLQPLIINAHDFQKANGEMA